MDAHLKACLVQRAEWVIEHNGMDALLTYRHHSGACGCMGPQRGEPHCSCTMDHLLEQHLVTIVNEIDPAAALCIMRARLIGALKG
jgi:hypothetical protein